MDTRDWTIAGLLAGAVLLAGTGVWVLFGLGWAMLAVSVSLFGIALLVNGIVEAPTMPDEPELHAVKGEPPDEVAVQMRNPLQGQRVQREERPRRRMVGRR